LANYAITMQKYNELKNLIDSLGADVEKIEAGNKAARTRVRVGLQAAKVLAQDLRIEINNLA
jgi:hypothetical protein